MPTGTPGGRLFGAKPGWYILIILVVALGAYAYHLRTAGIFACRSSGYESDRYLAYCQATNYGDYDHGAFWFGLEPAAREAATAAEVLFIGNSRMQFALSTKATSAWFATPAVRFYLMGFSHNANYRFEGPLLQRLRPRAKVYIINLDLFFENRDTPPALAVMHEETAKRRYVQKRLWQRIHRRVCGSLPMVCRDEAAFFRSPPTGAWVVRGGEFTGRPVSYVDSVNRRIFGDYVARAPGFLSQLPVGADCIILTNIPTVDTGAGTAGAIATALNLKLVAPRLEGLTTFDGSHLNPASAERWSAAFAEAAAPQVRKCLGQPPESAFPARVP